MGKRTWLAVLCGGLALVLGICLGRWSVLQGGAVLQGGGTSHLPELELTAPLPQSQEQARINLNTASAGELMELPGVGQVLAERILAAREQRGGFTQLAQLRQIQGIGESLYRKLEQLVYLPED